MEASVPLRLVRRDTRRSRFARLGDAMQRHRRAILVIQWVIVLGYAVLIALPAFLPLPPAGAAIASNLTLFAQFAFWGIWWPFVILSMMLVGRVWCGVFCPEGALTEFASRYGLGRAIPRWMRWSGWPVLAFVGTTVYGQLISVYEYPKAALLILGGSTAAALAIGFVYGRGKRVWCRFLCPVQGVFALLAKLAPVHFRVDADAWVRHPGRAQRVDCAPLIDIRHMKSASACHACGRCSGHRDAVALAARSPNREILAAAPHEIGGANAVLLVFGMLGVALGAFQWSASPWFIALKQRAAEWLVAHDLLWPLDDGAPWWLLTHYPQASDVFTWLDGLAILTYILGYALCVGGVSWIALRGAARIAGGTLLDWKSLALGLVPLAGASLFVGLSMSTVTQLRAEGWPIPGIGALRAALLASAAAWSLWLGWRLFARSAAPAWRRAIGLVLYGLPVAVTSTSWWLMFAGWR